MAVGAGYELGMVLGIHHLLRLLLIACFAVYGVFASAGIAPNGSFMSIEICANGVPSTIQVDVNGVPVTPTHHCQDCLACTQLAATPGGTAMPVALRLALYDTLSAVARYDAPAIEKPTARPMPRGPPSAVRFALVNTCANAPDDGEPRGIGRPLFKDAAL